jgi:diguanylate cyclase (GGDEF)-like protein
VMYVFALNMAAPTLFIGVVIGAVMTQSLYGSARSAMIRTAGATVALASLMLTTSAVAIPNTARSGLIASFPIPALFACFMRAMFVMLQRQEQANAREAVLATTGRQLLGITETAAARAVIHDAADDLCRMTPGLGLLIVTDDGSRGAMVRSTHGRAEPLADRPFPASCVAEFDSADIGTVQRPEKNTAGLRDLTELAGQRRGGWHVMGIAAGAGRGWLVVGTDRRPPEGLFNVLRTLTTQLSLAEANCASHAELSRLAHNDQLTTTPNRGAFLRLLAQAVDSTAGQENTVALLIVDLDDFKQVNDRLGHGAGDAVLIEVAARMVDVAATSGIASRFGGDEFALLLTGLNAAEQADEVANRLRERLREPIQLAGEAVTIGASIGVVSSAPGRTAADLMRCADIAMYSAKARGKNRVERFFEERHGGIAQVRQFEDHLGDAVRRGEIVVHYQPLVDLKTGHCHSVEALPRWQHPTLGMLLPEIFMPIAERQGQIEELGAHVLRTACQQIMEWAGTETAAHLGLTVNVSTRQLTASGFDDVVRAALTSSGLSPARLTLEFVESDTLGENLGRTQLQAIATLGVRIALDNFSGGLTSLAHLQAMPLHQLKIDRELFVSGDETPSDAIQLIMSVSQFLRLETVAQGVETPQHAEWARLAGVTLAQGSLFSSALPAPRIVAWLSQVPVPG